jgi:hypothetical protein
MKRFLSMSSVLVVAIALAAGCNKKSENKEEPKAADTATTPPAGGEPTAAAQPATPAEQPTATAPAAGGAGQKYTADQACDKTLGMMEAMGAAVTANKGNCDGMGDALQKWADENKEFIAWGKANEQDAALKKEFEEKCTPKMSAVMEKVGAAMSGAQECAQNEKVKKAMAALE